MKSHRIFIIMALLLVGMTAFAAVRVTGNRKLTTKTINISDFNKIRIRGNADFIYSQNVSPSTIEVTVDQNLHPYINIEVKDRELSISFKGAKVDYLTKFIVRANSKWLNSVDLNESCGFTVNTVLTGDEIEIHSAGNSLVQLKQPVKIGLLTLDSSDASNIVVNDIDVEKLICKLGSGSITVKKGKASTGKFDINGKGDLNTMSLPVNTVDCVIVGSGEAKIYVTDVLKAKVVGSGKVLYKGTPAMDSSILGKGNVEAVQQ